LLIFAGAIKAQKFFRNLYIVVVLILTHRYPTPLRDKDIILKNQVGRQFAEKDVLLRIDPDPRRSSEIAMPPWLAIEKSKNVAEKEGHLRRNQILGGVTSTEY
jgi:hypothetical protein